MNKTKECLFCKKQFYKKQTTSKKMWKKAKYCSFKCYAKHRKITPQPQKCIESLKRYLKKIGAKEKTKFTCEECGKEFIEYYGNRRKKHIFCSPKCNYLWVSKNLVGKNSPNYINGNTSKINKRCHSSWWRKIRKRIYERDNFTCQICGIKCTRKMDGTKIQCHHLGDSENHNDDNLLTVCLKCHASLDFNRRKLAQVERYF